MTRAVFHMRGAGARALLVPLVMLAALGAHAVRGAHLEREHEAMVRPPAARRVRAVDAATVCQQGPRGLRMERDRAGFAHAGAAATFARCCGRRGFGGELRIRGEAARADLCPLSPCGLAHCEYC
jgi:hypothetical protein